jgi:uncharacterized membrane protein
MLTKIFSLTVLSIAAYSNILFGILDYDIQDIGTLQTHSSQAIALNNKGQILGWYNLDGTQTGKHPFFRDTDGTFTELPLKEANLPIDWQWLTDNGKAYGTFAVNTATTALCMWDQHNGFLKLGVLPGKEIMAINNLGQVLIKSVTETIDGKKVTSPVVWDHGRVTKLPGLLGNLGVESDESYGFDMNNKGEVVGQSLVYIMYKNEVYKQIHATKWVDGKAIDLHYSVPKQEKTWASAINDLSNVLINSNVDDKLNNLNYRLLHGFIYAASFENGLLKSNRTIYGLGDINSKVSNDFDTIWLSAKKFISINDTGKIIAEGITIYGEHHAMLLIPKQSN